MALSYSQNEEVKQKAVKISRAIDGDVDKEAVDLEKTELGSKLKKQHDLFYSIRKVHKKIKKAKVKAEKDPYFNKNRLFDYEDTSEPVRQYLRGATFDAITRLFHSYGRLSPQSHCIRSGNDNF